MVPVLWVMLVLTLLTAVQRFARVWAQGSAPRPTPVGHVAEPPHCAHHRAHLAAPGADPSRTLTRSTR